MRAFLMALLIVGIVSNCHAQHSVPITDSALAAVFDRTGDHLFVLLEDRVQQIRTSNAEVMREFSIPGRSIEPEDETPGWYTVGLISEDRELVVVEPNKRILILNLAGPAVTPNAQWEVIAVPQFLQKATPPSTNNYLIFGGVLSDGRLIIETGRAKSARRSYLALYDRDQKAYVGTPVEVKGTTYLAYEPEKNAISGVRTTYVIGDPYGYWWSLCPFRMEKLEIRWDERSNGEIKVVAEAKLPDFPNTISPDLNEYTIDIVELQTEKRFWLSSAVDHIQWHEDSAPMQILPRPIHRVFQVRGRGCGAACWWSGDSKLLFIAGADDSQNPTQSSVVVYTRSGRHIATLPIGVAHLVYVLAVSHDGRQVVTVSGVKEADSTRLWQLK